MSDEHRVNETPMSFRARAEPRPRGGITIGLPFDPDAAWGSKDRHYIHGTIGGYPMRGALSNDGDRWVLSLGPAWCRDPRVGPGNDLAVVLRPEGPQLGSMTPDIVAAISADPAARRHFESLATHYRNGFVDWIESAKRPETRARRIAETAAALREGRRAP